MVLYDRGDLVDVYKTWNFWFGQKLVELLRKQVSLSGGLRNFLSPAADEWFTPVQAHHGMGSSGAIIL